MAQITFYGNQQTTSANVFANGPAEKADYNIQSTDLFYNSSNPLAIGDTLYTDPGYTTVFQGGGGSEWVYVTDLNGGVGNYAVRIDGNNNSTLGEVLDIVTGPTHTIEFQDMSSNVITAVNEDTPFKMVVTETGTPSMSPVVTITGSSQVDVNDFDTGQYAWPFTSNTSDPQNPVDDFTVSFSNGTFTQNFYTLADLSSEGNEVFAVQLTNGEVASITINDTSTLPTFDCAEAGLITIPPGAVGDSIVVGNITVGTGTATAVSPPTYQLGTTTYDVDITIPAGYLNAGSTITCQQSAIGTTTTTTQPPNQPPVLTADPLQVSVVNDLNDGDLEWVQINIGNNFTDAEGDTCTVVITSGPTNGSVSEFQNGTIISASAFPFTIPNNGLSFWYTPNNFINGSESFTYSVSDGTNTPVNGTIVVSSNPPQNVAPTAENYNAILDGEFVGNGLIREFSFERKHAANPPAQTGEQYSFIWVDDDPEGASYSTLAELNATLNHGEVISVTGETFTYELNDNVDLGPDDQALTEEIYYKISETNTPELYSDIGVINITINAPLNEDPVWQTPSSSPESIVLNQFSVSPVINLLAVDPNAGDNVSYSVNVSPQNGNLITTNISSGEIQYDPGNYSGPDTFTIRASDGNNPPGFSDMVFDVTVNQVQYIQVVVSAWGNSSSTVCNYPRDAAGTFYINTAQAPSFNALSVGDTIYSDQLFQNPWVSEDSNTFGWISAADINDLGSVKSFKVDATGVITEVVACQVVGNQAWQIEVGNSISTNAFCNLQSWTIAPIWQNLDPSYSLADVVNNGGQLFNSEYDANAYSGQTAPNNIVLSDGIYFDPVYQYPGKYYELQNGVWQTNTDPNSQFVGTKTFDCPDPIIWETKSINLKWLPSNPTSIGAICNTSANQLSDITVYYKAPTGITYTIKDIATGQMRIFNSESAATSNDYSQLVNSSIFIDPFTGRFYIWNNDDETGYSDASQWYAFAQSDNSIELAQTGSVGGTCDGNLSNQLQDYLRDDYSGITYEIGSPTGTRPNAFYAFYACEVRLDAGIPGGDSYWPLFVIDGMHTNDAQSTSYIKDFIDTLGDTQTYINSTECMTLKHKVWALDLQDAIDQLRDNVFVYRENNVRPLTVNPQDIGLGSNQVVNYGSTDCSSCILSSESVNSYQFPIIDDAEILNRSIPNFDLETNYKLDNVSKPLLRTNPKLSTNAKLVVNSDDKVFIESINATKELASVSYKKWEVNADGKYAYDLQKFYAFSYTTPDIMYATRVEYSDFAVQESFDKQIEELYQYGTKYNYSKLHDEDYRLFAPIWLDKEIPKKFIIFRVSDPVGSVDFDDRGMFDNIQELLKKSEIIKTFDLTKDSTIGSYIRNHVESELFPKSPITFNFSENEKSTFNGIDLKKGGFTKKGEYLNKDFVVSDSPLISSNKMITDGFERNTIACANLLNLEFLFDDDQVSDYGINRYFGLYVNDIDSGYGTLSSADNGVLTFKTLNSHINGLNYSAIPSFKHISQTPTLGYVSISDDFYKISSRSNYVPKELNVVVEDSSNKIPQEIKIAPNGNSVDMTKNDNAGFDFVKVEVTSTPTNNDKFIVFSSKESSYSVKFLRHNPLEAWDIKFNQYGVENIVTITTQSSLLATFAIIKNEFTQYPNIKVDWDIDEKTIYFTESKSTLEDLELDFVTNGLNNSYSTFVKVSQIQTSFNLDNGTFIASDSIDAGKFSSTSYSNKGSLVEINKALVSCINANQNDFEAVSALGSTEFYVKSKVKGYKLLQSGILVPNSNSSTFLSIENYDSDNLLNLDDSTGSVVVNNSVYYMIGGNSAGKSVYVSLDSVSDLNIGDFIETKKLNVYNKVIDIVDDIDRLPTTFKKVILEEVNDLESGEIKIYADNLAKIGLFSAFDIHDLNVDFYDTSNSKLKELQYESAENINYIPEQNSAGTEDEVSVFSTDYDLEPANYFTGINDVLPEELADQYNEVKLFTEYDRLNENNLKEFAVTSRVVPNINKWVLKDTLTVREQPYYLNSNEAFGRSNFSPDITVPGRDRLGMTHEWFYLDKLPKYLNYDQINDTFSYVNFNEDFELEPIHFKSTSSDYFDRFMISEGFEIKDSYGIVSFIKTNLKKKYTLIDGGNDTSFSSTIFKGLKVLFKNRKEFDKNVTEDFVKNSEFNGYRFSTLVKVKTGQESNDISYEVIQNKKFKFVIFFITVSLDDLWSDGKINRKLLYELNHSLVWKGDPGTEIFEYSDIPISGAMDLNSLNTTDQNAQDYLVLSGITHEDGSLPQFVEQINADDNNEFGVIKVTLNADSGPFNLYLPIASVSDQDEIILSGPPTDAESGGNIVPLFNLPDYLQTEAEYLYLKGGKNAYKNILDSLSISNVYNLLKQNDGQVVYTTIEENGDILNNRFQIEFQDGEEIVKESFLLTTSDTDKPKSFKLSKGNIGFNLMAGAVYYPFLVRHNGDYTVDTTPVVTFTDMYTHFKTNDLQSTINSSELNFEESMYKHSLTDVEEINIARDYYKRYNRCGTSFNLGFIQDGGEHDSNWGIIKNHFYRKVNEINTAGVTKLSTSTEKLPLYPLIGEIAIDKKDVNVFRSSWDKNYYTRSLSGGESELVPGTFETKEEKSYLGSTVMKPKESYSLLNFNVDYVDSQETQDSILINSNNSGDVVVFEDKNKIYVDFYIDSLIKKTLSNDGILNSISRYVNAINSAGDKTTIKDDVEFYITKNLVNLFTVDSIKLYSKRIKGIDSEILSTSNIDALDDGGYDVDKNFTFKQHEQKPLNFRLIYNKRLGYSYRIRPMIKIKS